MRPIPLAPLQPAEKAAADLASRGDDDEERRPRRRLGRLRRAARYVGSPLGSWAGAGAIRSSASFIGESFKEVRVASRRDPRFRLFPNGEFDLEATAFLFGVSVADLERRLAARRRQSAYMAYIGLALAVASCVGWLCHAFGSPGYGGMFMLTLDALGFAAICVLAAFYQALVNFQLRARCAVGWKAYLMTDRGFWPTP